MQPAPSPSSLPVRTPAERPLGPGASFALGAAATAVTLLFYLFAVAALLLVVALLLLEIPIFVLALRFGAAGSVGSMMGAQAALGFFLLQSLNLRRDDTPRLALGPEDAPRLYALLDELSRRVEVAPPSEVVVEMGPEAAVMLRGHARGRGQATLLLGLDLIAALSEAELAAVVAHEMAHARLVQRGYRGWLLNAFQRIAQVSAGIRYLLSEQSNGGASFFSARLILFGANGLGWALSRLIAAHSRQDEFAADRFAADVCGSQVFGEALLRTLTIAQRASGIGWRDRVVQSQRGGSLVSWLREGLTPSTLGDEQELLKKALEGKDDSGFHTHPTPSDRLAHVGYRDAARLSAVAEPASRLLADADALAGRLIRHGEETVRARQRKESDERVRELRKQHKTVRYSPLRGFLWVTALLGAAWALLLLLILDLHGPQAGGNLAFLIGVAVGSVGLGVWSRMLKPLAGQPLPVPAIGGWEAARGQQDEARSSLPEGQQLETRVAGQLPSGGRQRREALASFTLEALRRCDYASALGAAIITRKQSTFDRTALMADAVASAYFRLPGRAAPARQTLLQKHGLDPSTSWAVGWSLMLEGEFSEAEPYLLAAAEGRPEEAALWSLLGESQWRIDKNLEAVRSLESAIALAPAETAPRYTLVQTLLELGRAGEAEPHLRMLEGVDAEDRRVLMGWIRADLLLGRMEDAGVRAALLAERWPGAETWRQLGHACYEAKDRERAERYFHSACAAGFCPDALFRLGQAAAERSDPANARRYFAAALDMTKESCEGSPHPLMLLDPVIDALLGLSEPVSGCSAWRSHLALFPTIGRFGGLALVVQARDANEAIGHIAWLHAALYPGRPFPAGLVHLTPLGRDQVPDGPLRPGIAGCCPVSSVI